MCVYPPCRRPAAITGHFHDVWCSIAALACCRKTRPPAPAPGSSGIFCEIRDRWAERKKCLRTKRSCGKGGEWAVNKTTYTTITGGTNDGRRRRRRNALCVKEEVRHSRCTYYMPATRHCGELRGALRQQRTERQKLLVVAALRKPDRPTEWKPSVNLPRARLPPPPPQPPQRYRRCLDRGNRSYSGCRRRRRHRRRRPHLRHYRVYGRPPARPTTTRARTPVCNASHGSAYFSACDRAHARLSVCCPRVLRAHACPHASVDRRRMIRWKIEKKSYNVVFVTVFLPYVTPDKIAEFARSCRERARRDLRRGVSSGVERQNSLCFLHRKTGCDTTAGPGTPLTAAVVRVHDAGRRCSRWYCRRVASALRRLPPSFFVQKVAGNGEKTTASAVRTYLIFSFYTVLPNKFPRLPFPAGYS